MKTLLCSLLFLSGACLNADEVEKDQIISKKFIDPFILVKMTIEDHTYFYIQGNINMDFTDFWHDPDCVRCTQKQRLSHEKIHRR